MKNQGSDEARRDHSHCQRQQTVAENNKSSAASQPQKIITGAGAELQGLRFVEAVDQLPEAAKI